jgi:hypothetical protein
MKELIVSPQHPSLSLTPGLLTPDLRARANHILVNTIIYGQFKTLPTSVISEPVELSWVILLLF